MLREIIAKAIYETPYLKLSEQGKIEVAQTLKQIAELLLKKHKGAFNHQRSYDYEEGYNDCRAKTLKALGIEEEK